VTSRTAQVGTFSRRMLAVAAVAAIALSFALTLRVAQANELFPNQLNDGPISWDDADFQGTAEDCAGANLDPGEVLWHFVHEGTNGTNLPATIDAEFDSVGSVPADGYSNGGGNAIVMYDVITGEDTLTGAEDTIVDDNKLLLSHICFGGEEQSVPASVPASGEQSVGGGTGTPEQSVSDGALSLNGVGPLPTIVFSLILLASLGGLAYANVKAARDIS
jgi:hypothetical protein